MTSSIKNIIPCRTSIFQIQIKMSISVRKIIDARVDGASSVNQHHDFATGASSSTFQSFEATSKSSGTLEFNVLVPGQNAYWNRRVMLETSVVYTATVQSNTLTGSKLRTGRDVATCGFPMNSLLQTVVTSINGSTVTTQQNQIMPLVRRLIASNNNSIKKYTCPAGVSVYADNAQAGTGDGNEILSSGRSSDRPSANGSYRVIEFGSMSGGKFTPSATPDEQLLTAATVSHETPTGGLSTIVFRITTREPLLAAPFITSDDEPAFTNVQSANVRCTLMQPGDASVRILRTNRSIYENVHNATNVASYTCDDAGTGSSYASLRPCYVKITNIAYQSQQPFETARIWCNFLSPSPDQLVPASTIYPYLQFDPLVNANPVAVKASGINGTLQIANLYSQTVVLNTCPDLLAIYAVMGEAVENGTPVDDSAIANIRNVACFSGREDLFATISRLSIMWNNQPAILASAPMNELWRMSYDNGLKLPFDVYTGLRMGGTNTDIVVPRDGNAFKSAVATTGMPVLLAINKDFPTEPGTAPGVAGVFSLQVSADVYYHGLPVATSGTPEQTRTCTLYVVPIRSQYLQLNAGGTSAVVGAVSSGEAMLDAPFADSRIIQDNKSKVQHMSGGANWGIPSFAAISSGASTVWKKSKEMVEKAKEAQKVYKDNEVAINAALGALGPNGQKALKGLKAVDELASEGTTLMDKAYKITGTGADRYHDRHEERKRARREYMGYDS